MSKIDQNDKRQADFWVWLTEHYGAVVRGSVLHEIATKATEIFATSPTPQAELPNEAVQAAAPPPAEPLGPSIGVHVARLIRQVADEEFRGKPWDCKLPEGDSITTLLENLANRIGMQLDSAGGWRRADAGGDEAEAKRKLTAVLGLCDSTAAWDTIIGNVEGQLSRLREQLAAAERERDEQKFRVDRQFEINNELRADLAAAEERIDGLKSRLDERTEQVHCLRIRAEDAEQRAAAAEAKLSAQAGQWVAGPPKEGERRLCWLCVAGGQGIAVATVIGKKLIGDEGQCIQLDGIKYIAHWIGPCPPVYVPQSESEAGSE